MKDCDRCKKWRARCKALENVIGEYQFILRALPELMEGVVDKECHKVLDFADGLDALEWDGYADD